MSEQEAGARFRGPLNAVAAAITAEVDC